MHNAFLTNQLPLEDFDPFFSFLCGVGITEECSVWHDNPEKNKVLLILAFESFIGLRLYSCACYCIQHSSIQVLFKEG